MLIYWRIYAMFNMSHLKTLNFTISHLFCLFLKVSLLLEEYSVKSYRKVYVNGLHKIVIIFVKYECSGCFELNETFALRSTNLLTNLGWA